MKHNLEAFSAEILWQKLFRDARCRVVPEFWSYFASPVQDKEKGAQLFVDAVALLRDEVKAHLHIFHLLDKLSGISGGSFDRYRVHLSAILLSQIPAHFEGVVNAFYSRAFKSFTSLEKRESSFGITLHC